MAMRGSSLRDKQIASLKKILNLNEDVDSGEHEDSQANGLSNSPIVWKVLVFDDLGQDVISSVLRVSDLRSLGVTIHLKITAQRAPIPDVPVVYLLEPTAQNLQRITDDLQKGLYSPAYINFLSSIPRPLLEDFATMTATAGTSEQIAHVYDQYLNFIVAEPDLFSLGMEKEHVYWALNSAKTKDEELDHVVDKIVSGLFSVVVTMGVIPIIRASRGAAAEMIAQKLDRKLRDHILNSGSKDGLFSNNRPNSSAGTPTSRPVLVLLDRNVDLTPMLSHGWTYQHLIHDVLNMKLNRITIETPVDETKPEKGVTKKSYDLTSNDYFWTKNSSLPFQEVAEDIDAELNRYKEESAAITKKTGVSDLEHLEMDTSASAQHLKAALTVLPELRERKGTLDMHMNILAAILSAIQKRSLNEYYSIESNVMRQTKAQILDLIKDKEKGDTPIDRLRLFIVWFLSTETDLSRAEWQQFEEALTAAGVDGTCLPYIRQVRATTKMTQLTTLDSSASQQQPSGSDLFNRFSNISSRLTDRLKESGVPTGALSANFDSIIGGLKNFLPENRDLTTTKIVESIMDPSSASSSAIAKTENYLYFDPRSDRARGTMPPPSTLRSGAGSAPGAMPGGVPAGGSGASFGQRRQGFSEAVVFTVGGGSMDEYGNLQEWVKRTAGAGDRTKRRIVYGSTELINAGNFIKEELERLGREVQ
ncbi:Vesicle trafficking between the ER and Golgi [Cytospora paraplurivora]|uniref:Vesicle trafficking between the ER and Golgi n=1 Tax=Cytospora paraplurivora TaxID=2898453 RepID=A0AAN9YL18_9PEZI